MQDEDAAPVDAQDAEVAEVRTRTKMIELAASEQPTNFALVLNVLSIIELSEYKVGGQRYCVLNLWQRKFDVNVACEPSTRPSRTICCLHLC